jgi:hypothetical protein
MEFVRVSADHWNFELASSGKRFVPFGANLIFYDPTHPMKWSLNILTRERWEPDTIRRAFQGAHDLHMNLMKVFLPGPEVLPDPQTNDAVRFAALTPSLFERLDDLFEVARQTGVYVSLSFAEWGMAGSQWFHEGGTFMGRQAEDGPGIDSFAVFRNFWQALAERYRNEPAIFSYNLAVELYLPDGNWGAGRALPAGASYDPSFLFGERWGDLAWRRWLMAFYGSLENVNQAWGTHYTSLAEICQPEMTWLAQESRYGVPQIVVADYVSFKECVTYDFLKNQTDAIRSMDTRHMVTCGLHPDQSGIAPAGWGPKTCGITHRELDFLDYLTPHLYTHIDYLLTRTPTLDDSPGRDAATLERRRREGLLYARFMECGKPLLMEEMGHSVSEPAEALTGTIALAEALKGHVSGLQIWFLSDVPKDAKEWLYGPLDTDLNVNAWGEAWKKLAEPGGLMSTWPERRVPAKTVIGLERQEGLAPIHETPAEKILKDWDAYEQPVDFDWPLNLVIWHARR